MIEKIVREHKVAACIVFFIGIVLLGALFCISLPEKPENKSTVLVNLENPLATIRFIYFVNEKNELLEWRCSSETVSLISAQLAFVPYKDWQQKAFPLPALTYFVNPQGGMFTNSAIPNPQYDPYVVLISPRFDFNGSGAIVSLPEAVWVSGPVFFSKGD